MKTGYILVARGLASRLRLKRIGTLATGAKNLGRQGIGFSPEIETVHGKREPIATDYVARGLASRLRLKPIL